MLPYVLHRRSPLVLLSQDLSQPDVKLSIGVSAEILFKSIAHRGWRCPDTVPSTGSVTDMVFSWSSCLHLPARHCSNGLCAASFLVLSLRPEAAQHHRHRSDVV